MNVHSDDVLEREPCCFVKSIAPFPFFGISIIRTCFTGLLTEVAEKFHSHSGRRRGLVFVAIDHSPVNVWYGERQSHLYPSIIESRHSCFILFYFVLFFNWNNFFFAIKVSNFGLTPGDADSHALRVFYWGHVCVNPGASMDIGGILKGLPRFLFSLSA